MLKNRERKLTDCDSKKPETSRKERNIMETAVEKAVSISSKEQWAHKVRQGETRMQFISIAMGGDALFLEVL